MPMKDDMPIVKEDVGIVREVMVVTLLVLACMLTMSIAST